MTQAPETPVSGLPFFNQAPAISRYWGRFLIVGWLLLVYFLLDKLSILLFDLWFLESLGFESVFWTNFKMGAALFAAGFFAFTLAIAVPAFACKLSARGRSLVVQMAAMGGLVAGYFLCLQYREFLLLFGRQEFGLTDSVFGNDLSIYVVSIPAYWAAWTAAFLCAITAVVSSAGCSLAANRQQERAADVNALSSLVGRMTSLYTLVSIGCVGLIGAIGMWLSRYDVLTRDNYPSAIHNGAQYVDINGFFSTVMDYNVRALVTLGITAVLIYLLVVLARAVHGEAQADWGRRVKRGLAAIAGLLLVAAAFRTSVAIRDTLFVDPNEPVVQLPYIEQHINSTLAAYGLENIEEVRFIPKASDDPLPDLGKLMRSPTLKNVPLWPGFENYIEPVVDPQHSERILVTQGDDMIYGPSLEVFTQQERLRPYYKFVNTDAVRYQIDGEPKMLVSSVRELPVNEPYPHLLQWGQRHVLFTHGHGLVMASAAHVTSEGEPVYLSNGVPTKAKHKELEIKSPAIYYGEGSAIFAFSNIREMPELDFPTDEGRAVIDLPDDVKAGVRIDSWLKRVVLGWRSGEFFEVVCSRLITPKTRVHYYRMPLERLNRLAPFLYFDHNKYAVTIDGRIIWMVNGMTTTDQYPYSKRYDLGDKSVSRSPYWVRQQFVQTNYLRDSVKATVDAQTGAVTLYKVADEPIVNTWAGIYPDLFVGGNEMPKSVRQHLQYPIQLYHVQFDDVYIDYHMKDPMTFFNQEDRWDDGDEVLGPILDRGKSITFSLEPTQCIVETDGNVIPESNGGWQFGMMMPYTSEGPKNLRALPIVFQDGDDYGRIVCLQVPKGHFTMGPEQADSVIDQEPDISEQISWWNRQGTDVIRGHTSTLVVDGELLYVEPIFIRSQQNPVTQLKKVVVVFRGVARMGNSLEEALKLALDTVGKTNGSVIVSAETAPSAAANESIPN